MDDLDYRDAEIINRHIAALEAKNTRLREENSKLRAEVTNTLRQFLDDGVCPEHREWIRSIGPCEYIEAVKNKCLHCMERERDEVRVENNRLRARVNTAVEHLRHLPAAE